MEDQPIQSTQPLTVPEIHHKSSMVGYIMTALMAIVFVVIGILVYSTLSNNNSNVPVNPNADDLNDTDSPDTGVDAALNAYTENVNWIFNGESWQASTTVSLCPEPLTFNSPVDITLVSGVLYPGQIRGGDYKPHGGFRFDDQTNEIVVEAPMSAILTRASRYIELGETQYLLEFVNSCGIMYRFDHILKLSPKLQAVIETLPAAKVDDSRTTFIQTSVTVEAGEIIATAVGFEITKNIGLDFGVYDLRSTNTVSLNPSWASQHNNEKELAFYAVCWLDMLQNGQASILESLPPVSSEGQSSDYCN